MQACDRCHARKTRCDRRFPQCGACEKARAPCIHADKLRQRNLPRGYIDSLEHLVEQLRADNKTLQHDLAISQAALDARTSSPPESRPIARDTTCSSTCSRQTQTDVSPGQSPDSSPLAVEVGYLSLVAAGEMRYLGSSSGLGLANILDTILSLQGGMDTYSSVENPSRRYSLQARDPTAPINTGIPPLSAAIPFVEAYFQHTHIAFPLLHRPTFLSTLEKIYGEPDYYDNHPFEAFVFDMVLAIGSSNYNRFDDSSAGSSTHFARAQSKLEPITALPDLQSLKVILLISQHGIFSNLRDTAASMWHLVGIGSRICFELGLHLERNKSNGTPGSESVSYDDEMRKRCFWCLYNLDRVVSFTLGRPFAIRDDEVSVSLPSHLDDDNFGPEKPAMLNPQEDQITPFLHIIRIRRLSGQISNVFYINVRERNATIEEKLRTRHRFHTDIDVWKSDTAKLRLVPNGDSISSFLSPEWYNAVYNNAILLLYRPSPYLPNPITISQSIDEEPDLVRLLSATKASIESYSDLHRQRRLNYSWITLHGVFVAGLAFVYSINSILRDATLHRVLPEILSIMEVCRRCSNVLVAICERWNASRQSCELFDKASTAMIRDALRATRMADAQKQCSNAIPGPLSPPFAEESNSAQQTDQEVQQISGTQLPAPTEAAGLSLPMTQIDEILGLGEPSNFRDMFDFSNRRETQTSSESILGVSQNWLLDVPFGLNEALDGAQVGDELSVWNFGI